MDELQVYWNGSFVPRSGAVMDIEDRAAMFADGVYEVTHYYGGRAFAMQAHLNRLRHSLAGIELAEPAAVRDLPAISDELVRRNNQPDASVYWQVSRGPAVRKHVYPTHPKPTVLVMTYPGKPLDVQASVPRAKVILSPDVRWERCCYKTLMLLPNAMAKNSALTRGADEAIFHRGEVITEGSSTNVFAVINGQLFTHPGDGRILPGITRQVVIELASELGYAVTEQAVSVKQLRAADEVLITGTTTQVTAVTHIDEQPVGRGEPGPMSVTLHRAFVKRVVRECGLGGL